MLYDEFLTGTGCRDNAKNFEVYKDLEILYMNSDISKEKIYEYGKKLVDNSLSEEQIAWNYNIDTQINELKEALGYWKGDIERYEQVLATEDNEEWRAYWKRELKYAKGQAKSIRWNIRQLKDCKYV